MAAPLPNGVKIHNGDYGYDTNSARSNVQSVVGDGLSTLDRRIQQSWSQIQTALPRERREDIWNQLQAVFSKNPRLSTFIVLNILFTGIPLCLFLIYSVSVFIFSLAVAILGALAFTFLSVGAALLVVLPTVLFTTTMACTVFLWGLAGYSMLSWLGYVSPSQKS